MLLLAGSAVPQDEARSLRPAALRTAAERGDAEAQYQLALAYLARGGPAGEREAVRWLKAAARQRHAAAQARLARIYAEGDAVRSDPRAAEALLPESTRLLEDAAAQGQPDALLGLARGARGGPGRLARPRRGPPAAPRRRGEGPAGGGVPPGRPLPGGQAGSPGRGRGATVAPLRRREGARGGAARPGPPARRDAGGAGDETEAVRWFRAAAEQGLPAAQYELGQACAHGVGVAARRGSGGALVPLGRREGPPRRDVQPRLDAGQRIRRAARRARPR